MISEVLSSLRNIIMSTFKWLLKHETSMVVLGMTEVITGDSKKEMKE